MSATLHGEGDVCLHFEFALPLSIWKAIQFKGSLDAKHFVGALPTPASPIVGFTAKFLAASMIPKQTVLGTTCQKPLQDTLQNPDGV